MRLCRRILLLLAALLLFLPAMAEEDGNLLVNGSFEMLDGDGLPSGWYTEAWVYDSAFSTYSVDSSAHTGSVAAVVSNLQGNDARFAQNVTVEPGSIYRLSGWIRAQELPDSGRGANISVGGVYCFSESVFDSEGEWVFVDLYGRTGPEQETLTVYARVGGYGGLSSGSAAFDDLRLEKVAAAPGNRLADKWYNEPAPVRPVVSEPTQVESEKPFWPWLLVIAGAYALLSWWGCRQVTGDTAEELRQGKGSVAQRLLLPLLLLTAAVLRVVIALNVTGYQVDVNCFVSWGMTFLQHGPWGFYEAASFCDYPPGYLYVMGFNEGLYRLFGGAMSPSFAHKLIPMLADLASAFLVWHVAREEKLSRRTAVLASAIVAFNPAIILNSAAWCQVDSVLCLLMLLVAYLAIRSRWAAVLPVYVLSILIKPQALMLGFLGLAAIVMALLKETPRVDGKGRLRFPRVWRQMGWGLLWSLLTALAVVLPAAIGMGGLGWLFELYGDTLASYPYATVNTANLYYLFGGNWRSILFTASRSVTAILLLICAAWCVVTFMRRRDKRLTLLEPAIAVVLTLGVAFAALGLIPLISGDGEGWILSTGDPWQVYNTESGYVREFIPGVEGAWAAEISPVLLLCCGVLLLAACGVMAYMLRLRLRDGVQQRIHTGLIEPALMLLFTVVFAFMLVFDTTWGALGTAAMALAFALVLPMFVRGGNMRMLPLCGAVLFILLYVFGVKMHERYIYPALFLLALAYAFLRDRRLVWLLTGLACAVFINEGIVLDNAIRLGAEQGHLNSDTRLLACLVSLLNTALALWSLWLCQRMCVEGALRTEEKEPAAVLPPAEEYPDEPCTPLNYEDTHRVRFGRIDLILILTVTLIYSVVTFTTLGSTRAPQTAYTMTDEHSQVVLDLGAHYDDFTLLYNCQVSYRDFSVETSDDGRTWTSDRFWTAQMAEGQCFRWKYLSPWYYRDTVKEYYGSNLESVIHLSGRYVRITAQRQYRLDEKYYPIDMQAQEPLIFNEILLRNAAGERIDAKVVGVLDPQTASMPAFSLRWRVSDAQEARLDAIAALQEEESGYLHRAAAPALLSIRGGAAPAVLKAGVTGVSDFTVPPYAASADALLDEPDSLDGEPGWWNSTYFDEIYHARTGFEHANGLDAYEWTHPPLGKVIMSWFIRLFGMTPFGWRFAGALCGVLMLPAMYVLAKQLTKKSSMGFAAMLLMAVDCMHFAQTRIATIDSYPVLFIILSYIFMLRFIQRDIVLTPIRRLLPDLALSGLFMGCGVASKWIGIYAGIGLAVLYFWACLRAIRVGLDAHRLKKTDCAFTSAQLQLLNRRDDPALRRVVFLCLWCLLFFVAVPLAIYLLSYVVHYQARAVSGLGEWLRLVWDTQINILNYHGTPGLGMDHAYYSPWYEWFTMQTPMYYASPAFVPQGWSYVIYCFGNPLVWYVGVAGVLYAAWRWLMGHRYRLTGHRGEWHVRAKTWDVAPAFVLVGLLAQLLPWVLVPRGTYIYHFFASVPFLILGAVLAMDRLCEKHRKWGPWIVLVYLVLALVMFVILWPGFSGMLVPEWWMDFVKGYPWRPLYQSGAWSEVSEWFYTLLEAIPLMPNIV